MQSIKDNGSKFPLNNTITLADFIQYEIPVEKLGEFNIYIPDYYRNSYNGTIFIMENEVVVKDLFLDDLEKESKNNPFFVFRKNVSVENALVQMEKDFGPVTTFQGDVIARNIWMGGGETTFEKDVTVAQTFIGVYNHGTTTVEGSLVAEVIISSDHALRTKNIKKGYIIGRNNDNTEYELIDIFQSKYYDKWEEVLKESNILKAILKGESIISDKSIQSPLEKRFSKLQESKIKKLDLSYMDLENIPDKVWELDEITVLDLSGNYIDTISDDIVKLNKLKKISIDNCEFTSFPEILSQLISLEEIESGHNQISDLPDSFSLLQSLKKLKFDEYHFEIVPDVLYSLPQLTELDISSQKTKSKLSIDKSFPKLKNLI